MQHRNVPRTLTARIRSNSPTASSVAMAFENTPALLTRMPTSPAPSNMAVTDASSAMSTSTAVPLHPVAERRAACALAPWASRSATTTFAPASARRLAMAAPNPCAAPVTIAVRPRSDSRSARASAVTLQSRPVVRSNGAFVYMRVRSNGCRGRGRSASPSAGVTTFAALEHRPETGTVGEHADVLVRSAVDDQHVGELARRQHSDVAPWRGVARAALRVRHSNAS